MMSLEARKRKLNLTYTTSEDLPPTIHSDPYRFRQILINLVNNSLKFTITGSVTINLSVSQDLSVTFLKCSVIDTGIGISPELCKKLFAPYVRGMESIGINKTGAGFGLSITKRLCEKLGGKIWVSSILGKGSTFIFTIPIISSQSKSIHYEKNTERAEKLTEHIKTESLAGLIEDSSPRVLENIKILVDSNSKILCVDDTPMVSLVLQGMLSKLGISCDIVNFYLFAKENRQMMDTRQLKNRLRNRKNQKVIV